jgi:hypothetical protein
VDLTRKTLLEQGLAEAQKLAILPDDADLIVFGVKEGDTVGGGIAVRLDDRWHLAGEATINVSTHDWGGRVMVVAKSKK